MNEVAGWESPASGFGGFMLLSAALFPLEVDTADSSDIAYNPRISRLWMTTEAETL